jgi:ATP synthase subunit 6
LSVRFFVASALLIWIFLVIPTSQLLGQENHQDPHHQQVTEGHPTEAPEGSHNGSQQEEYNASEFIMEHVLDAHEWHIITKKNGQHVSVYLPVIVYSRHSGLHAFSSKKLAHGQTYRGFQMGEGMLGKTSLKGKVVEVDENGNMVEAGIPLDFSITKNVLMMMLSIVILLWVFLSLARSYKRAGIAEPKGLQGFIEPVIVFIAEDVAIPNIGEEKYHRYMPYLLTVFFFILINNLMGLIPFFPFGANVTGNIAVTFVLASFTFLITTFSGNKGYWQHIFNTPGVPVWLAPIMIPVEIIGMITKPFALMIRLFANITAGHIVVLSLISMIFIFKSIFMSVPSLVMVLFMDCIELLVAFLQAYIFTLLSALFIGLAMPEHHHD